MRPTRESVNIRIAQIISERGTCERLKVGAVITHNNRIIATGYNGPCKDADHCNSFTCDTDKPCGRSVHAEVNALQTSNLDWYVGNTFKDPNIALYCTHQPCLNCAISILRYTVGIVYYIHEYRDKSGLNFLLENGIKVIRLDEQGNPQ